MLQKLNDRLQGIVTWVIVILITITFILFGIDYYLQAHQTTTQVVAQINGIDLSKNKLDEKIDRFRQEHSSELLNQTTLKQVRAQFLEELILEEIAQQAAKKAGFYIAPIQVRNAIFSLPAFQTNGKFSSARYQELLRSASLSSDFFQHQLAEGMLLNQQRFAFIGTAFVLPNELDAYIQKMAQKRDYRYLTLSIKTFLPLMKKIPEPKALETYYQRHQQQYESPERVGIDYVELSMKGNLAKEFSSQLDQLTELSYQFPESLGPIVEHMGLSVTKLPLLSRQDHPHLSKQLINAAFSEDVLAGNNSVPIQLNDKTVVVLRIREHEAVHVRSFAEVREQVIHDMKHEAARQLMNRVAQSLLNTTENNTLMKQYALEWTVVPAASQLDSKHTSSILMEMAFSLDRPLMRKGLWTVKDAQYTLVQLDAIHPVKSLSEIDEGQKKAWIEALETEDGLMAYELYLKQQLALSKIKKT